MKKTLALVLVFICLFSTLTFGDDSINSDLTSALLGDYETGEILYGYNIDNPVEIASITKLMTYLVAMDEISSGRFSLEDVVVIGRAPTMVRGSSFKLKEGEEVTLELLLDVALIASGNDACVAISDHIAGSEPQFVKLMNEKAKELGLESAVFFNSSGMPEKEGQNMMSPVDIFQLSRYIINKYPQTLDITIRKSIDIPERNYKKDNTNGLIGYMEGVDGLKTGFTNRAGYCLVSTLEVIEESEDTVPFRLIGIVTGTSSEEARKIKSEVVLRYGIDNFNKIQVLSKEVPVKSIKIGDARNIDIDVFPKEDVFSLVKKGNNITKEISIREGLKAPIAKEQEIGKMIIYNEGKILKEVGLIVNNDVKRANFFIRIFRYIGAWVGLR